MRILLLLIVIVNLWLFAQGRGYFGVPPSEVGRTLMSTPPINAKLVTLGDPTIMPYQAP